MKVKATAGVIVPREDNPRRYITGETELEVEASAYYLRRIADGDLSVVPDNTVVPASESGTVIPAAGSPAASEAQTGTDTEEEEQ